MTAQNRPRLRRLEMHPIADESHDGALLSDPEGLFTSPVFVARGLFPVLARFDGTRTLDEIAADLEAEFGQQVAAEDVGRIAENLDRRLCLETESTRALLAARDAEFAAMRVRKMRHAGSAGYPADPQECRARLDAILSSPSAGSESEPSGRIHGLIAPHIDLARGEAGYAAAYSALRRDGPADLYVLFGTAHRGPRSVLVPTRKDFETPLGVVACDQDFVSAIEAAIEPTSAGARNHELREEKLHIDEHSLEFQVVFLQHLFGAEAHADDDPARPFRIAPFLTGALPPSPETDPQVERLVEAFVEACHGRRDQRIVFVAGADLAHEGPFFGDPDPVADVRLARLQDEDRASLEFLRLGDRGEFYRHVEQGGNPRRICGTTPCWFAERLAREFGGSDANLLHYGQAVADDRSQVVSFAAMEFRGP